MLKRLIDNTCILYILLHKDICAVCIALYNIKVHVYSYLTQKHSAPFNIRRCINNSSEYYSVPGIFNAERKTEFP